MRWNGNSSLVSLVKTFDRYLPHGRFLRNVTVLAGGTIAGQGLLILASPLLSRLYAPADFGALAVYAATVSILVSICSLRYEMAIPLPQEDRTALGLGVLSFFLTAATSLLAGAVAGFFGPPLLRWSHADALRPYLWLLPLGLMGAGCYQILNYWAVRVKAFDQIARTKLTQNVGQLTVQIGVRIVTIGPLGLVLGDMAGRISGSAALWKTVPAETARECLNFPFLRKVAAEYARFPGSMVWASLLNAMSLQAPVLMIPAGFGTAAAGSFFFSYRLLILPASLVGGAIGQAFFAEAARTGDQPERLQSISRRLAIALFAANAPIYIGIGMVGTGIFRFAFGENWAMAGLFAQIMAFRALLWSVANPLSSLLIVKDRLKESLFFTFMDLAFEVIAIGVGIAFGSLILAVSLFSALGSLLMLFSIWRFLRAGGVSLFELLRPSFRIFAINLLVIGLGSVPLLLGKNWVGMTPLLAFVPFAYYATFRWVRGIV
jgi:O-antigen/teichoic acid export membrane protein